MEAASASFSYVIGIQGVGRGCAFHGEGKGHDFSCACSHIELLTSQHLQLKSMKVEYGCKSFQLRL